MDVIDEIVTIVSICVICVVSVLYLKGEGTEIVAAGLGGLAGYLTKANKNGGVE